MTYNFDTKDTPVMDSEDLARAIKAYVQVHYNNGIPVLNMILADCNIMVHRFTGNQLDYDNPANNNDGE